jgi:hypothetical protein
MTFGTVFSSSNRCCFHNEANIPATFDNLLTLTMSGYIYNKTPIWYDSEGFELRPLQFSLRARDLVYKWAFYSHDSDINTIEIVEGEPGLVYFVSTSDDVCPTICADGRELQIEKSAIHNGEVLWRVKLG